LTAFLRVVFKRIIQIRAAHGFTTNIPNTSLLYFFEYADPNSDGHLRLGDKKAVRKQYNKKVFTTSVEKQSECEISNHKVKIYTKDDMIIQLNINDNECLLLALV
jgi:hypothetical protein